LTDFGKIPTKEGNEDKDEVAEPIKSFDEPIIEPNFEDDDGFDGPQVSKPRIRKKKLFVMLFIAIALAAGVYFAIFMPSEKEPEVIESPKIAQPPSFIDDKEAENKILKEDTEAKKSNVNIFEFDINNCLQKYTDAECADLYDKSLQIDE
jgi:hypothetical protein